RIYRSVRVADAFRMSSLGQAWEHNHTVHLMATPSTNPTVVAILSPEGYVRTFVKAPDNSFWTPKNSADALNQIGGAWVYKRADDDSVLIFTADGKLQTKTDRSGRAIAYTYDSSGRLLSVTNAFGRSLLFTYLDDKLVTVTTPDHRVIAYAYDLLG